MDTKALVSVGAAVFVGAFLVLLGADIIPQRVFEPNVPSWVLVVIGLALLLAGTSVFFRIGSPTATRMIGVCMLFMALSFFWVALFGDPGHMNSDLPYLSDRLNLFLGRSMFGLGGLLWLWLGISALRHAKHQPQEGVAESDQ